MLITLEELKVYFEELDSQYVGYIQLSDRRIEDVWTQLRKLPKWESLHTGINYILEMALFDPKSKQSILVRQHNDQWLVLEKDLKEVDDSNIDSFYTVTPNTPKMKIAQIWEEEENGFCLNMKVLEPKYLMFAGFEEIKEEQP